MTFVASSMRSAICQYARHASQRRMIHTSHALSSIQQHHDQSNQPTKQLRILQLNVPILDQLRIEEALLRNSPHSHLILNQHVGPPSIVLGISGRPELWTHMKTCQDDQIPLIKRFTGGGTVYVDPSTLFVTFLIQRSHLPHVQAYPQPILQWAYQQYQHVFNPILDAKHNQSQSTSETPLQFKLNANDFCLNDSKIAGNAQSITKNAWLHHTSWLWQADKQAMTKYLKQPPLDRLPEYRRLRSHESFVASLSQAFDSDVTATDGLAVIANGLCETLRADGWELVDQPMDELRTVLSKKHDRVTEVLDLDTEYARIERQAAAKLAQAQQQSGS